MKVLRLQGWKRPDPLLASLADASLDAAISRLRERLLKQHQATSAVGQAIQDKANDIAECCSQIARIAEDARRLRGGGK